MNGLFLLYSLISYWMIDVVRSKSKIQAYSSVISNSFTSPGANVNGIF